MTEPALSVVVPSVNGRQDLIGCLTALERQREDVDIEILVPDRCGAELRAEVRRAFPKATIIEAEAGTPIPELRAMAIGAARGRALAVIEDHVIVPPGWARALLAALERDDMVVGGAIENAATERLVN